MSIVAHPAHLVSCSLSHFVLAFTMIAALQPIAIVSYGYRHESHKVVTKVLRQFIDVYGDDSVEFVDLRNLLPNPLDGKQERVRHGYDGTHQDTVVSVYSQARFAEVAIQLMELVCSQRPNLKVVAVACTTSFHRADTMCRTLQDVLNSVQDLGERAFSALFFPTCNLSGYKELEKQVDWACSWSVNAWTDVPQRQHANYDEFTRYRPDAARQYAEVWAGVARMSEVLSPTIVEVVDSDDTVKVEVVESAEMVQAPPALVRREPAYAPPAHLKRREPLPRPPSPPPPLPKRSRPTTARPSSSNDINLEPVPPMHMESWEYVGPFDVVQWIDVLNKWGIDATSRMELILLGQLSAAGAEQANWIVSKLLKKAADGDVLQNPSAFLHSAVMKARYHLQNNRQ